MMSQKGFIFSELAPWCGDRIELSKHLNLPGIALHLMYNSVSIPTLLAVAGPHGQLVSWLIINSMGTYSLDGLLFKSN